MKRKLSLLGLALTILISGCSIFKRGCGCPHVSYIAPVTTKITKPA